MKIIQLIQKPQLRGAEIFACQLSNHLKEQGHEVLVVSIFKGDSELPFKGKLISLDRPLSKRFFDLNGWKKFNSIIRKFKPDIIQANAADTLKFAVSSKILFSWKHPLVYRNANKMGDFITSKLKWQLNNFYMSKVAYVISVSKECEKDFIKTFSYPQKKINTVEIGVEEQELEGIPGDLQKIFKRGPVITHIGGFVPEKNHDGLINIFNKSLEKFPETQLLLLGKGNLEMKIKSKVEELQIQNNVHFLGYRSDVLDILNNSKAFVLPSLIEGLPAVILEAMYCEIPVVAYNVGGIGEVVVQGKTGWLVEKNEQAKFQEHLEEILTGNENIADRVKTAKNMISDKFLNKQIAQGFAKRYFEVLNHKSGYV
ncbi:glycosyltransferase [Salegentibacter salegens]|uniref:Glycosyltransferase involved in cell wall bisynthesis n=1 Tax=Salegentibacter salegens TaxID=143223 RepID=A0A1M7HDG9_9FLAO|nr:glycosyltransferase [Salegentibacter salegens]PRX43494.1 glycosyltransferase involved in cell wall biosynthesis [Salegentibacter salegens]SHM26525.1 Glycosyltransferase involved in cell wall bisynthesis [Salegentibacter salegens]